MCLALGCIPDTCGLQSLEHITSHHEIRVLLSGRPLWALTGMIRMTQVKAMCELLGDEWRLPAVLVTNSKAALSTSGTWGAERAPTGLLLL